MSGSVAPVFPAVAMQDDAAPFVARASVLPDQLDRDRDSRRRAGSPGRRVADPTRPGCWTHTTPAETASLTNREGEPIQLPPRMRWMTDFPTAVQVGMALDIAVAADIDRLDDLLVIGVRLTETPAHSADTLGALFSGHRFSRGLAFVPQDTPTNNSISGGSGLPSRAERIDTAFTLERRPRAFTTGADANGQGPRAHSVCPPRCSRRYPMPARLRP